MIESEVQSIVANCLTNQDTQTGFVNAYYDISLKILKKLGQAETPLLKDNAFAKSRLAIFMGLRPNSHVQMSAGRVEDFLFIYSHWLQVMLYMDDHYLDIDSLRFKTLWSPLQISDLKEIIRDKKESYQRQFLEKGGITFKVTELPLADQMFNWCYVIILGEEMFRAFLKEINKSLEIIRKFQKELREQITIE